MKPELAFRSSPRLGKFARAYLGGGSVESAPPRNLTQEMLQTLAGNQAVAGPQFALESQYQPLYNQLQLGLQRQSMFGFDDSTGAHQPGTLELGRGATRYQRAGDIQDVQDLGPASTEAFLSANPFLRSSLNNLSSRTNDSAILSRLNTDAESALASGGALSPQEERDNQQRTLAGFADRGTTMGNQSLGAELLSRDAAVRQRAAEARKFAGDVQGLNEHQNDFVGRASQIFGTTLSDPFQAILGRSSGSGSSGGGAATQQIGTGARLFDPMNPYAQDVYNSNFNQRNAENIANANNSTAQQNAWLTTIGALAGGLLSDERLKKNVKKVGETKDEIPIVEFEYITDPTNTRYRGVKAQDVEKVRPQNVKTDPVSGVKMVDYWGLGMPMELAA